MGHADFVGLQIPLGKGRLQLSQALCRDHASTANGVEVLQGAGRQLQAGDHVRAQRQRLPDVLDVGLQ
ncbi:hypothetical protein D3C85_1083670 [compost metagenome]